MNILNSLQKLLHDLCNIVLGQIHLVKVVIELSTSHTLHGYIDPLARLKELKHLNHIRVTDHANNQQLVSQKLLFLRI